MRISSDLSENSSNPSILFILGSPRVGSTVLYQFIINHFECFFPSNKFNRAFENKNFNLESKELGQFVSPLSRVDYISKYGKTILDDDPSEASAFLKLFWRRASFRRKSSKPLPGYESLFLNFCKSLAKQVQNPLVFKNAWNCFRINYLSKAFSNGCFIWIRRDIADAAYSDLQSRKKHGGKNVWNSATTADFLEIQKLPYWEQVVEQQYSYGKRISADLKQFCKNRYLEVWYEELCSNTSLVLKKITKFLGAHSFQIKDPLPLQCDLSISNSKRRILTCDDGKKIRRYADGLKFSDFRRS